ncbi:MAG: hypothetical protein SVP52_08325 [Chloroflexota bacterium]|nr:hypothetical protein [Chloroflexota bacterium]
MYDINLLSLKVHQGQQEFVSTGFKASAAPRRASRSRSEDMLIMSLSFKGDSQVALDIQKSWVDNLIQSFFKTGGSVTSAMRTLIETLNLTLMEKNLKSGREGGPTTAALNLAAIHRRVLYIVQSGQTHAFVLSQQRLAHFYDTSQTDRGLGLSRSPNIRYYQAEIGRGSYFFTTTDPPETWTEDAIFAGGFPSLEQLRRRLLSQVPQSFRLDLAQILPGEGQVNIQHTQEQADIEGDDSTRVDTSDSSVVGSETTPDPDDQEVFDTQEMKPESAETEIVGPGSEEVSVIDRNVEPLLSEALAPDGSQTEVGPSSEVTLQAAENNTRTDTSDKTTTSVSNDPENKREAAGKLIAEPEQIRERSLKGLAAIVSGWGSVREKVGTFFTDLISRWAPTSPDGTPRLSGGTLLLIALVVPLIVVAIGASVYFARGRTLQYEAYMEQAQISANIALNAEDPNQSRDAWHQTLAYLDQAGSYKETDEILTLREQVQDALDELDGAVRLAYQPAIIGSLYSEINITEIISYGPDLYLLDSAGGRVIHAERGSQGYEVDPDFVCAQGNYSGGRIEALVDMVSLPINNAYQAHILAVDALGNAAYCGPGQNPVVQSLPSAGGNSGEITSIAYDSHYLYVLNATNNTIFVYRPTNGQFLDNPSNFFEGVDFAEIPNLNTVVDIAVNGPSLYLLQGDGKLIDCTTSGLAGNPVTCINPVDYIDGRPGKEEQKFIMSESNYIGVLYTSPPDPAINILDAQNADIYRLSLRFRLHNRLRPEMGDFELESPVATAFTIGIDRVAFLAFGHQVFYAYVE